MLVDLEEAVGTTKSSARRTRTKSEIRRSKSETNPKKKNSKFETAGRAGLENLRIGILHLFRASDFGLKAIRPRPDSDSLTKSSLNEILAREKRCQLADNMTLGRSAPLRFGHSIRSIGKVELFVDF
jgi:hypothetical protein